MHLDSRLHGQLIFDEIEQTFEDCEIWVGRNDFAGPRRVGNHQAKGLSRYFVRLIADGLIEHPAKVFDGEVVMPSRKRLKPRFVGAHLGSVTISISNNTAEILALCKTPITSDG
jgi:hypothetical protein